MDPCERRLFSVAAAVAPAVTTRLALRAFLATVALPILLDVRLGDVAVASFVSTDIHWNLPGRLMRRPATRKYTGVAAREQRARTVPGTI
jgi:hypothetical protein